VIRSHQQMNRAQRPMMRIRETGGTGQDSMATGQKSTAVSAIPIKKIAERIRIMARRGF